MGMAGHRLEIRIDAERSDRQGKTFQIVERHRQLVGERQHLVIGPAARISLTTAGANGPLNSIPNTTAPHGAGCGITDRVMRAFSCVYKP